MIFKPELVERIIAGLKTQTRRPATPWLEKQIDPDVARRLLIGGNGGNVFDAWALTFKIKE